MVPPPSNDYHLISYLLYDTGAIILEFGHQFVNNSSQFPISVSAWSDPNTAPTPASAPPWSCDSPRVPFPTGDAVCFFRHPVIVGQKVVIHHAPPRGSIRYRSNRRRCRMAAR